MILSRDELHRILRFRVIRMQHPHDEQSILQAYRNGAIGARGLFRHKTHEPRVDCFRIYFFIRHLKQFALERRHLFVGDDPLAPDDVFWRFIAHDRITF